MSHSRWSDRPLQPRKAKASFAKAKLNCQKQGVRSPIHLDYIVSQVDNSMVQQASSFKQSVESALGADNVVMRAKKVSDDDFQNITYSAILLREITISQAVVGAPDYQDPSDLPRKYQPSKWFCLYYLGIDAGSNNPAIATVGLDQYANMLKDAVLNCWIKLNAMKICSSVNSSITLPTVSNGGAPVTDKQPGRAASWSWYKTKPSTNAKCPKDVV